MKVKAPFKIAYDGPYSFRVWGYGLGYLPMGFLQFGYNLRGSAARLNVHSWWRTDRNGKPYIASTFFLSADAARRKQDKP